MDSEARSTPPPPQAPDSALFFKAQSEAQTLLNLKGMVISVMLMTQPTISFTTEALSLTQQLFQHLAGPLMHRQGEQEDELPSG